MGTRHSTLVQCDREYRVAQYGQWDGYPEGQGATILEALRGLDVIDFRQKVRGLRTVTQEDLDRRWRAAGSDGSGMVSFEVAERFEETNFHLDRDCGGKIIGLIASGEVTEVALAPEFPGDSLFCEWAYVVDLDRNTFEVYQGFNTKPLDVDERFYPLQHTEHAQQERERRQTIHEDTYYPVRFVCAWPLDALPTNEAFLTQANVNDEEEKAEEAA
jgi:hypothetical protein